MSFDGVEIRAPFASASFELRTSGATGRDVVLPLSAGAGRQRLAWGLVTMLMLFALAHLLVRGPIDLRGNVNLCDYANHYAAARLWLIGGNPYDSGLLPVVWQASWPAPFDPPLDHWWGLLPPGAYAALAPLGALPAWSATLLWLALSAAAVAASLFVALSLANVRATSMTGLLLISGALAAAPFQTLLAVGQVSLFAVALILLSIWCAQRERAAMAGILLAVAACLKPQLAAPFGLFYLLYRNWTLVGFATIAGMALNVIGIAQLEWRGGAGGLAWWTAWTANIAASTSAGQANDATLSGPWRHQIVSLHVLLHAMFGAKWMVMIANLLLSGALIAAYAWLVRRGRFTSDALLSLSILCALALLPVYHRSYDAALLVVPLAWALTSLRGGLRRAAWVTLAALSVFLIPFDALPMAQQRLGLFGQVSQTWAWKALIETHHAWAALGVCCALLGALYLRVRQLGAVYDTSERPDVIPLHAHQRAADTAARWRLARDRDSQRARRTG